MSSSSPEIEKRKAAGLAAIQAALGTEAGKESVDLFVAHHLEELDSSYWEEHFQTATPEPVRILEGLVFDSHWGEDEDEDEVGDGDEGIEFFDFTLPGEVTDYLLSVQFDEAGVVEGISMES